MIQSQWNEIRREKIIASVSGKPSGEQSVKMYGYHPASKEFNSSTAGRILGSISAQWNIPPECRQHTNQNTI